MRADEYVVEKLMAAENKNVELTAALKAKENDYKNAVKAIKELKAAYEEITNVIGVFGAGNSSTDLAMGGCLSIYISDPYGEDRYLNEKDAGRRRAFKLFKEIIEDYREAHPKPKEEEGEESDS